MSPAKRKTTAGIIANNPMSAALAAMLISGVGKNKRSEAERKAFEAKQQAQKDESIRQAQIRKNLCPACSGKLIRGRKQKKNDYKRAWRCVDCNEIHLL